MDDVNIFVLLGKLQGYFIGQMLNQLPVLQLAADDVVQPVVEVFYVAAVL
jgi:hypothetical protein